MTDTLVDVAERVIEVRKECVEDGVGHWRTCSGCFNTVDGYPVGHYPHSDVLDCTVGSGCSECGGIGAVWDNTDYADYAKFVVEEDRKDTERDETIRGLREALEPFANAACHFDRKPHGDHEHVVSPIGENRDALICTVGDLRRARKEAVGPMPVPMD
jgi:hypothetical protein